MLPFSNQQQGVYKIGRRNVHRSPDKSVMQGTPQIFEHMRVKMAEAQAEMEEEDFDLILSLDDTIHHTL